MDLPWRRIFAGLATNFTLIHKSHLSLAHYFRWVSCRAQVLKNKNKKTIKRIYLSVPSSLKGGYRYAILLVFP